ncbi:hypothetical protein NKG05_22100 [Oerskovia sp. M15]
MRHVGTAGGEAGERRRRAGSCRERTGAVVRWPDDLAAATFASCPTTPLTSRPSPPFGGVAWTTTRRRATGSGGGWGVGTVGSCVPSGYAAYARIPDAPAWAEEEEGIGSLYLGQGDESGPEQMDLLLDVLAPFTGDQECHFALWTGYGWLYDHGTRPEDSTSFGLLSFGIDDVGEGTRRGPRSRRRRPRPGASAAGRAPGRATSGADARAAAPGVPPVARAARAGHRLRVAPPVAHVVVAG